MPFSCPSGRSRCLGVLFLALVALFVCGQSFAATFFVNQYYVSDDSPNDFGDANPGDGVAETLPGSGIASFRTCLEEARAHEGPDTIIVGGQCQERDTNCGGIEPLDIEPKFIKPFSPLPPLDDATGGITIIGSDACVQLDGEKLPQVGETPGLILRSSGNYLFNLVIIRFPGDGIVIENVASESDPEGAHAVGNEIHACAIGTDLEAENLGNVQNGIRIRSGAVDSLVYDCVISGNGSGNNAQSNGILIEGAGTTENKIFYNAIGLRLEEIPCIGTFPLHLGDLPRPLLFGVLPNKMNGILIADGASGNFIGGPGDREGNHISANGTIENDVAYGNGVVLSGFGTNDNVVQGNVIGLLESDYREGGCESPEDCGPPFGEPTFADAGNVITGVLIDSGASNNRIGGAGLGEKNIISDSSVGILVTDIGTIGNQIQGNWVGLDKLGDRLPQGCFTRGCDDDCSVCYYHVSVANGLGIWVFGASGTLLGGIEEGAGNIVCGSGSRGILIGGGGNALTVGTVIQGNQVGSLPNGSYYGNGFSGIALAEGSQGTLVGGPEPGARNYLRGNTNDGIVIYGSNSLPTSDNVVQNNYIRDNSIMGVFLLRGTTNNLIGGTSMYTRNVLLSNGRDGVRIANAGSVGNTIAGNLVGIDEQGVLAGNENFGVAVIEGATDNMVGGTSEGAANIVTGNLMSGVQISGTDTERNQSRRNSIYANIEEGIIHSFNGNDNFPAPAITGIGPLRGTSEGFAQIEVFSDSEDEGKDFVASVTANELGNWTITGVDLLPFSGRNLTATATSTTGNTSEFSEPLFIIAPSVTQDPVDVLVVEGDTFNLSAAGEGTPTLNYQWQFSPDGAAFSDIPFGGRFSGVQSTLLLNTGSTLEDRGFYRCVISNAVGATPSLAARVTVVAGNLTSAAVNTLIDTADGDTQDFAHAVTFPGPDGKISLRELILASNTMEGPNSINF
ncbi:MAG: hypothetical protein HYV26_08900, partial [Candidatus Hydrogenedentes bacterium]|nr:hypothetical protein [Candidatus Hydrogenedentota bacterium]